MAVVDKPLLYEDRVTHRRVAVSILGSQRGQISFEVAFEIGFTRPRVLHIFDKTSKEQKSRYMSRQKQIDLAKERNQKHIGPKEEIFN